MRRTRAQRLRDGVARVVPSDERLLGAFEAGEGPEPAEELLSGCLVGPFEWLLLPVVGLFSGSGGRTLFTVAVTDRAVLLYRHPRFGKNLSLEARYEGHEALGPLHGDLRYSIHIAGFPYWLMPYWSDEVRRLHRLIGS